MSRRILTVVFSLAFLSSSAPAWAEPAPEGKPLVTEAADFEKLTAELGDPAFKVREAASEELARRGEAAREPLSRALLSTDLEVKARAQALLKTLDAARDPKPYKAVLPEDERTALLKLLLEKNMKEMMPPLPPGPNNGPRIQINMNGLAIDQDDLALLKAMRGAQVPSLGVLKATSCPAELAEQLRIKGGILVRDVPPDAPEGGLRRNDLILAAGGTELADPEALEALAAASDGKPLELTVLRKGEKIAVAVTPHKAP